MPFNILHFYSTHLLGIHRNCLFSSWSFLILWFSSKDSSPVLASGGTNLILSFSVHRGEKKYCYLRGSIESEFITQNIKNMSTQNRIQLSAFLIYIDSPNLKKRKRSLLNVSKGQPLFSSADFYKTPYTKCISQNQKQQEWEAIVNIHYNQSPHFTYGE